jgi:hypothetical protein
MSPRDAPTNPFRYGSLALDDAFTNRTAELRELEADIRNGQDVVIFAPRRYGKSSLVWRAEQDLSGDGVLLATVDLMTTPTKEKLAEKLAGAIHRDLLSGLDRARERTASFFRGLRITPTITVDPSDGSLGFSFAAGHVRSDVDATLERLLELPAEIAAERKRTVGLIFDEFQEVVDIDADLPKLMRAVFQTQPEVAHVYLGSKRHMLTRIFNDANEPFWRSARQMELGKIQVGEFADFIVARFAASGKTIDAAGVARILELTGGHPYATQELAYAAWEETPPGGAADAATVDAGLDRVLRSEHAHFSLLWDEASAGQKVVLEALAAEPGRPYSSEYRARHGLPPATNVQKALTALTKRELVARDPEERYAIAEPFFATWIARSIT